MSAAWTGSLIPRPAARETDRPGATNAARPPAMDATTAPHPRRCSAAARAWPSTRAPSLASMRLARAWSTKTVMCSPSYNQGGAARRDAEDAQVRCRLRREHVRCGEPSSPEPVQPGELVDQRFEIERLCQLGGH